MRSSSRSRRSRAGPPGDARRGGRSRAARRGPRRAAPAPGPGRRRLPAHDGDGARRRQRQRDRHRGARRLGRPAVGDRLRGAREGRGHRPLRDRCGHVLPPAPGVGDRHLREPPRPLGVAAGLHRAARDRPRGARADDRGPEVPPPDRDLPPPAGAGAARLLPDDGGPALRGGRPDARGAAGGRPRPRARDPDGGAAPLQGRLQRAGAARRGEQHLRGGGVPRPARGRPAGRVGRERTLAGPGEEPVRRGLRQAEPAGRGALREHALGARVRRPVGGPPRAPRRRVGPLPPAAGEPFLRPHLEHGVDADPRGPDRALPDGRLRPLLRAAVHGVRRARVGRASGRVPPAHRPRLLLLAGPLRPRRRPGRQRLGPAAVRPLVRGRRRPVVLGQAGGLGRSVAGDGRRRGRGLGPLPDDGFRPQGDPPRERRERAGDRRDRGRPARRRGLATLPRGRRPGGRLPPPRLPRRLLRALAPPARAPGGDGSPPSWSTASSSGG